MTLPQLHEAYDAGRIATHEFLCSVLDRLDPTDPGAALGALPPGLRGRLRALVDDWRPGAMRSNHGPVTTPEANVRAAREWLGAKDRLGAGRG